MLKTDSVGLHLPQGGQGSLPHSCLGNGIHEVSLSIREKIPRTWLFRGTASSWLLERLQEEAHLLHFPILSRLAVSWLRATAGVYLYPYAVCIWFCVCGLQQTGKKRERNSSRLLCLGIKTSGRTHESIICRGYFYLADHFSSRETSLQLSRGCFCQLRSGQVGPGASHLCSEGHGVG